MLKINQIHNMNCIDGLKLLDDDSINCCITSPPYWGLRDYGINGQIGLEDNLQQYIKTLVTVFQEVKRILRPDGTLWLNLGDTYVGTGGDRRKAVAREIFNIQQSHQPKNGRYERNKKLAEIKLKPKDLVGIPWRVAFALQEAGWYLRQDIIWEKPNCMPEAVKDRTTKSHEYIFLLAKSKKYYYDHLAVMEDCVNGDPNAPRGSIGAMGHSQKGRRLKGNNKSFRGGGVYTKGQSFNNHTDIERESHGNKPNPLFKRNRRSVWSVATAQKKEAHFATFPEKLIEPCALAGCPKGGIIIDPFMGSGTVAYVSMINQRNFIGFEINLDYCKIAEKRLQNIQLKMG